MHNKPHTRVTATSSPQEVQGAGPPGYPRLPGPLVGYPQMPVGNRSTCRNKVLGRVNDNPAAALVYRLPAHSVPTICPQLQITLVNCSDDFSQFRYRARVSTSPSKRLYTPAVGGSIPSAPTKVCAVQHRIDSELGFSVQPPLCQDCVSDWGSSGRRFKSCQPDQVRGSFQPDTGTRMPGGRDDWNPGGRPDPRRHRLPETTQTQMSLVCWRRALSSFLVPFPFLGVLFSSFAGREWRRQRG
jgi:hypothetical protein